VQPHRQLAYIYTPSSRDFMLPQLLNQLCLDFIPPTAVSDYPNIFFKVLDLEKKQQCRQESCQLAYNTY